MLRLLLPPLLLISFSASGSVRRTVTLSNVVPHTERGTENIIDAHDGSIALIDGPRGKEFFWYAMGYGYNVKTGDPEDCPEDGHWCINCGRHFNNTIGVWTSPDLSPGSWVKRGSAIGAGWPWAEYYRSHVLFNKKTGRYVLWANVGSGPGGAYAVSSSASADGPFDYHGSASPPNGHGGGDMTLFLDDDGSAYTVVTQLRHGAGPRDMVVFKLASDFLGFAAANETSGVLPGPKLVEAPDMIKRKGTYYVLLGGCTCFGKHGSGVAYLAASSPLGPYTHQSSTLDPGCDISATPDCYDVGPKGPSQGGPGHNASGHCRPVLQAQQNFVIQYPTAGGGVGYIWTGDRWMSAPDKPVALFAHDFQTWAPLEFDDDADAGGGGGGGGAILPMAWHDSFTIDLEY